jgi:hypothetical protein
LIKRMYWEKNEGEGESKEDGENESDEERDNEE